MAVIYMKHPRHGAKVAISENEAIFDEMNGWTRYDPTTPVKAVEADAAPAEVVNEMAETKRRGRPRIKPEE